MRRPIVSINMFSVILIFILQKGIYIIIPLIVIIIFILHKKSFVLIMFFLLVVSISFYINDLKLSKYDDFDTHIKAVGYFKKYKASDDFIFITKEINSQKSSFTILIKNDLATSISEELIYKDIYEITYIKNEFFKRNPNTFNYKEYLNSKGIVDVKKISEINIKKSGKASAFNIDFITNKIRKDINTKLSKILKEKDYGICKALLFGDKSLIEENILDLFRKNGTAHVLAISGLHIGLLYGLIYKLLFLIKKEKRSTVSLLLLFCYIFIIGIPISAMRAGLMLVFSIIALTSERKYDMLNVISLISLVLVFLNPLVIFDISFQLSFIAVLVLASLYKTFKHKLDTKKSLFWHILLLPLVIQLGMLPISIYHFNHFSLLSFIINIPTIFIMTIVLYLLVFLVLTMYVFPFLTPVLSFLINKLISLTNELNEIYASFDILDFDQVSPPLYIVIIFYMFLILLTYKKRRKLYIIITSCVILFGILYSTFVVEVYFFDIGQGDSILIKQTFRTNILIDGGIQTDNSYLKELLQKNGVDSLDAVMVSHAHNDHIGGVINISKDMDIKKILYKSPNQKEDIFLDLIKNTKADLVELGSGDMISINGFRFKTYGLSVGDNLNNSSLVSSVKIFDTNILFTGDIEEEAEEILVRNNDIKKIDILKIPHHGSDTSSTDKFVDLINTEVAIACVGKNNYGHPVKSIMDKYKMAFRTDYGCIKIIILPFNIYFIIQYS